MLPIPPQLLGLLVLLALGTVQTAALAEVKINDDNDYYRPIPKQQNETLALGTDVHSTTSAEATCANFWFSFHHHSYKYVAARMNWADAELNCLSQDANLVSIHSTAEHNFVRAMIKNCDPRDSPIWIGLSDLHKEGSWMWSDGSKVNFAMWGANEPNNGEGGIEHCGQANFWNDNLWNDNLCPDFYSSICKSRA